MQKITDAMDIIYGVLRKLLYFMVCYYAILGLVVAVVAQPEGYVVSIFVREPLSFTQFKNGVIMDGTFNRTMFALYTINILLYTIYVMFQHYVLDKKFFTVGDWFEYFLTYVYLLFYCFLNKMLYLDDFVAVLISIYITRHILQLLVSKFKKNSKYFVLVYENTPMGEAVQSSDDSEEENVEIELQENPEVQ